MKAYIYTKNFHLDKATRKPHYLYLVKYYLCFLLIIYYNSNLDYKKW
jgi:hypothetical protein